MPLPQDIMKVLSLQKYVAQLERRSAMAAVGAADGQPANKRSRYQQEQTS